MAFGISFPALEAKVELGALQVAIWVLALVLLLTLCGCCFGIDFIRRSLNPKNDGRRRPAARSSSEPLSRIEEGGGVGETKTAAHGLGRFCRSHSSSSKHSSRTKVPAQQRRHTTQPERKPNKAKSFSGGSFVTSARKPGPPERELGLRIDKLKEMLAKDDEARQAEESELSRLSHSGWADDESTGGAPAADEVRVCASEKREERASFFMFQRIKPALPVTCVA